MCSRTYWRNFDEKPRKPVAPYQGGDWICDLHPSDKTEKVSKSIDKHAKEECQLGDKNNTEA
jgi:hypothetical protein